MFIAAFRENGLPLAIRNDNGCRDANVNGSDFAAGAPGPRNSASPAQLCSCD